jgi:L-ascorbate metabolism protein UlaG (beta-lactamase superfamily)
MPRDGDAISLPTGDSRPEAASCSVYFVGTATVILRLGAFTILTDPNFLHAGDHVHLGYGLHSRRLTNPAVELDDLPPFDFVLLSHYHGDHFDHEVERRLDRGVRIVTTPQAARVLAGKGFRSVHEIGTWSSLAFEKADQRLRVTAAPGRHGPPVLSALLPEVMGSIVEFGTRAVPDRLRLWISGDTLVHDALREIPRRFPAIDLALLHLGGTRILGILLTMDARQGVEAIRIVQPRRVVPIHYDDYTVFRSPLADFVRAVEAAGFADRVHYLERGETLKIELGEEAGSHGPMRAGV